MSAFKNNSLIQLSCNVSQRYSRVLDDFEKKFCHALSAHLAHDLVEKVVLVSRDAWTKNGRAVLVDVKWKAANAAAVTISVGHMNSGVFSLKSKEETRLVSYDQKLTPSSSRTLVRGIGIQLGIIR